MFLANETATDQLGHALAHALLLQRAAIERTGFVIGLSGDLGAGKTALVRALLRALGVTGPVKSPTFSLLELYVVSSLNFYHFDFYRFSDPQEFAAAGFRELFGPGNVCAVEWPERVSTELPTPDLTVALQVKDAGLEKVGRDAHLVANTELGVACLNQVIARWTPRRIGSAAAS